jgi:four helix bundle protein
VAFDLPIRDGIRFAPESQQLEVCIFNFQIHVMAHEDFERQLKERMLRFSVDVVRTAEGLRRSYTTEIVSKQLIRCASSVGANYRSACKGKSKADFIAKLAIAEEESDETQYWLELLYALELLNPETFQKLHGEARELTAILASSGKTAKLNR